MRFYIIPPIPKIPLVALSLCAALLLSTPALADTNGAGTPAAVHGGDSLQAKPQIIPTAPTGIHAGPSHDSGGDSARQRARIVTDEKTGTVRVEIDGKDVVTIDAGGLHVNGEIDYTTLIHTQGLHNLPLPLEAPPK